MRTLSNYLSTQVYSLVALKNARVTPIPKVGDKSNFSNYRPISVLPVFSKNLKKAAYKPLYDYLEYNSIVHRNQKWLMR